MCKYITNLKAILNSNLTPLFDNKLPYHKQSIDFLKGVGPIKGDLLRKELDIFTMEELLFEFPFRYVDKTTINRIKDIHSNGQVVQLKGILTDHRVVKGKNRSRVVASFKDPSGIIELVWFKGVSWIEKSLKKGEEYIVYGKVNVYHGNKNIAHPEMDLVSQAKKKTRGTLEPVYHSTEKLARKGVDLKLRKSCIKEILSKVPDSYYQETLPQSVLTKLKLCKKKESLHWIHFPPDYAQLQQATNRIKFEEIFWLQLKMIAEKKERNKKLVGINFEKIGKHFNDFFKNNLPFELTGAQKRVIKEIRADLGSGAQMNRLLQGDVGSGKTIVGFMSMLIAIDSGYQACMMAPTQILAQQHYDSILELSRGLGLKVAFLTGHIKGEKRRNILKFLKSGDLDIIIGTHALIEDTVQFKKLGLAITDEQHRFGVAQRSRLWTKNADNPPHILVMTATPIPRTLAMTLYGNLDISVIDELPPGRKEIKTLHRRESSRPRVIEFMHQEIKKGRQIYVVFPLIEESAHLDLQNLQIGYDRLLPFFPKPDFQISVVHGRMKPQDKDAEMQRFATQKTQIMVATTVIEVGVNVPNASVMIIENANRFGLSQLHQLRGRVGRGAEQSFCVLMTDFKVSKEAKEKLDIMCQTNDGFKIAEADLRLRGAGNIEGTQQSGILEFNLLDISEDNAIVQAARHVALEILNDDPALEKEENKMLKDNLTYLKATKKSWRRIS